MSRALVPRLPCGPGVYRFVDERGRTLYVGRAVDLRRRVGSYWGDLGDRRHLRRMVARIARIDAIACDSGHEAAWPVAWISQDQKVHRHGGSDFAAHGYAGGLLLRLEFHDGRLDGWRVRPSSPQSAEPLVAGTPSQWQLFAQRNAVLAAALRTPP